MLINPPYNHNDSDFNCNSPPSNLNACSPGTTTLIAVGGCGEFGRNLTALICDQKLYIIDCGVLFPDNKHLGISGIFYDLAPIIDRFGLPQAYLITHAHRDHVGALVYFLNRWPAKVFATPWTIKCIEGDLRSANLDHLNSLLNEVQNNQPFNLESVCFEYISVNHSIPESSSLYIKTPYHHIAHSGDFKIDPNCKLEPAADLERWSQIAAENKIDLFLCDSTNAGVSGSSPSENITLKSLTKQISSAPQRVFIATFGSNLWRLINIIDCAKSANKKVVALGYGINNTLDIAAKLNIYKCDPEIVDSWSSEISKGNARQDQYNEITKYSDCNHVFIVSGSQLEPRSVLARILNNSYPGLSIQYQDRVIFSSRTIPGFEKTFAKAKGIIMWQGGEVITTDIDKNIHVSGHAYDQDIDILLSIIKPRYFIPIHGDLVNLLANAKARKTTQCFLWKNLQGCILHKNQIYNYKLDQELNQLYIDNTTYQIIDQACVKSRKKLAASGMIVVSGMYDLYQRSISKSIVWDIRGAVINEQFVQKHQLNHIIIEAIDDYIYENFEKLENNQLNDHHQDLVNQMIKARIRNYIKQILGFKPTLISHVWLHY